MECAICKTRSAVGYCATCRAMLCEVCGSACQACGKGMCPTHRTRTPEGRGLCPECAAASNAQAAIQQALAQPGPPPAAPPPPAQPAGGTSFADLIGDLGGAPLMRPVAVPEPEPEKRAAPAPAAPPRPQPQPPQPARRAGAPVPAGPVDLDELERRAAALLAKSMEEEEQNFRVLTGSAPQGTPMWLSSLFLGGLAILLMLLTRGQGATAFAAIQDLMRWVVVVVGMGAVLWSGYGFYGGGRSPRGRNLCLIGLLLGMAAVLGMLPSFFG